jgi:integrase/recombinase XerD
MSIPLITIFVRHSKGCPYQGDEFNKRCRCKKHLTWTLAGKQERRKTGTGSWAEAEEVKKNIEASFEPMKPVDEKKDAPKMWGDAIDLFITDRRNQELDEGVIKKYLRELGRFRIFMEKRTKFFVAEVRMEDCVKYKATWKEAYPSSTTRNEIICS